jgi:hypothetical protein
MLEVITANQYLKLSKGKIESAHTVSEDGVFYASLDVIHGYPTPSGDDVFYWSSLTLLCDDSCDAIRVRPNSVIIPVVLCDIASYNDYLTLHFDLRHPVTAARNILVNELLCRMSYDKFEAIADAESLAIDFDQRYYFELTFLSQRVDDAPASDEGKAEPEASVAPA